LIKGKIILKDKQARILLSLRNNQQPWHITTLAQACGTTYVHACNFIKECESLGLTSNEKHGKIKEIKLTEKGMKVADSISNIYSILDQQPQQKPQAAEPQKPPVAASNGEKR
jgi:predicted transcriptional regulator